MKSFRNTRLLFAVLAGLSVSALAFAADSFDLAKAKAAYPLDTCVVSGEPLTDGDMGPPVDFVYKQEGKPDRLVRFCCNMCVKKFKKDPAKYLKAIDDAAAAKTTTPAAKTDSMSGMDMK
ncbi:MAG TPA: hypothetical protein VL357_04910 [Rariglobus sp.]|jgi:hypothetical protein|nr:hypothetical protein [Rariglobus sp.]